MSDVIDFPGGPGGPGRPPETNQRIITQKPLRMRWGGWRTSQIIQVHVQTAALYEDFREQALSKNQDPNAQMPAHFTLDDGQRITALALLRHRGRPEALADVCYLAALMEALVNTPCAILRTDLIRRVYQEVERLSQGLSLRWSGRPDQFMLPVMEDARDPQSFGRAVAPLVNLQDFFRTVRGLAEERLNILGSSYVIYFPRHASM